MAKLLKCIFLFLNVFFVIIVLSAQDNGNERICTEDFLIVKTGFIAIPATKDCEEFTYNLKSANETSIIKISLSNTIDVDSTTHSDQKLTSHTEPPAHSSTIPHAGNKDLEYSKLTIIFEEFDEDADAFVSLNKWTVTPKDIMVKDNVYFSRTSQVDLKVIAHGDWGGCNAKILFEEHVFELKEYFNLNSTITPPEYGELSYRPNTLFLYRLQKPQQSEIHSISMTLWFLDIDDGLGEYLLIGEGENMFRGSPPLFIAEYRKSPRFFHIIGENAYILFVARSTRNYHEGFRIDWEFNETKVIDDENEERDNTINEDVLESIQVCITNISAASAELAKKNEHFLRFRKDIAKTASEYARKKSIPRDISSEKVSIYRVSAQEENMGEGGTLYVMLKITGSKKGKAAFTWDQLNDIFDEYSKGESQNENEYKIKRCPDNRMNWSHDWGLYAIIPVVCCILLIIATWKINPISKYFAEPNLKTMSELDPSDQNLNPYASNPRVELSAAQTTNEGARRYTMDFTDTERALRDDETAETVSGITEETIPKQLFSSVLNPKFTSGIENAAFQGDELETRSINNSGQDDNVYDTVESYKSAKSGGVVFETKL